MSGHSFTDNRPVFPDGLLRALARRSAWPRAELAQHLSIAESEVEAGLDILDSLGLALLRTEARVGLRDPLELLDEARIRAAGTGGDRGLKLHVLEQVDSTNTRLAQMRRQGMAPPMACVADIQWAGRGRRGRQWLMPPGSGLPLSILWDIHHWPVPDPTITLATGVVVIRVLESLGARGLSLKWPNDILVHGRKLGGILVEGHAQAGSGAGLILGLGLNLRLPEGLPIDQPYGDLQGAGLDPAVSRNVLAARLLEALTDMLIAYPDPGFAAYRAQWLAHDACAGRSVVVRGTRTLEGTGCGVDAGGRLRVLTAGGMELVEAGEVSLRADP
ncbi:biotin--[acetyl-CoA-carboxylase] ligase [Ectothiorhodospira lacustris]|uniref:biotin--[acetyl-CoA-carboxylase] ligase n=1 Tax=Ectothiorhodospira lacustris TaxID=2899127 RepID=UPI001EE924A9|nr:biotin--[acetyl-CoA-carboxylase] ligase [Ectothiorhodospira lacustris]MCG5501105.1 biotin--[acetyl-CoA-carboxylase] ligase [Ectothiorhodospira lacustris]MCG5510839.1 biotin--[acetyl-CoA-carboxylase] ligase [Ectothiorhodospira lacustris]MCG5522615.1 biotin--[acetyl-CoA-carboxylase] ligase [Ectothiorhodospira lacustris]